MDLGFLIDSSYNLRRVGRGAFRLLTRYIARLLYTLRISTQETRVGMVTYASRPRPLFRFNRFFRASSMLSVIRRIRLQRGPLRIGKALYYARRYLFRRRRQCGRKRVLVVFASARSVDRVQRVGRVLRRMGIEVFVVGFGRRFSKAQLFKIATNGLHVFTATPRTLAAVLGAIRAKACSGILWVKFVINNSQSCSHTLSCLRIVFNPLNRTVTVYKLISLITISTVLFATVKKAITFNGYNQPWITLQISRLLSHRNIIQVTTR